MNKRDLAAYPRRCSKVVAKIRKDADFALISGAHLPSHVTESFAWTAALDARCLVREARYLGLLPREVAT